MKIPLMTADAPTSNTERAGGTRYSGGKPAMTWSPWLGMLAVSGVAEYGATKYAPLDWLSGQSYSTLLNSAMRHLVRSMADPLAPDPESQHLHVAHATWNLLALLHFHEAGRSGELNDVSKWHGVTTAHRKAQEPE